MESVINEIKNLCPFLKIPVQEDILKQEHSEKKGFCPKEFLGVMRSVLP